jgi:hypothetical protein
MKTLEEIKDVKIHLPFKVIAKLAAIAYIDKIDFNDLVEQILLQHIEENKL